MSLFLTLRNSGVMPGGRSTVEMAGGVLTIGRGEENDLCLPDPQRMLSKRHCVLEARNGDYVIIDLSTNGTFLNYGAERLSEVPTPLNDGDIIQLGDFELVVEIAAETLDPDPLAVTPLPPAEPLSASPLPVGRAAVDLESALDGAGTGTGDFLDDLLGGRPDVPASQARPAFDRDALALDAPQPGRSPLDDALGLSPPAEARGLPDGSSAPDHSPATQDHFAAPAQRQSLIPDDWDDLIAPPAGAAAPEAAQGSRDNPFGAAPEPADARQALPGGAATPSPIPAAPPPTAPHPAMPSRPPRPVPPAQGEDAAARAFLEAAGAGHLAIPAAEMPETMARLGRVFAAIVEGMRDVLLARASIKSEMRMNRTMISTGGNNPLKFSISPDQAVEAMIRPTVRGYLDAEAATTEALNDIKAHEVAMMSGMEAALKHLLSRLCPDELAARIESRSSLGGLLGGKKARYWEAYEKMYAEIARETEDDFQSTFGKEFARAYEEQLKKL